MNFTNINTKSHYSLLQSSLKVADIIQHAVANDFNYVCLCDNNFFGGALEFHFEAQKAKLIPVHGLSFRLNYDDNLIKINAYARNKTGFDNLAYLSSQLYLNDLVVAYEDIKAFLADFVIIIDLYQDYLFSSFAYKSADLGTRLESLTVMFGDFYYYFSVVNEDYCQEIASSLNSARQLIVSEASYRISEDALLVEVLQCIAKKEVLNLNTCKKQGQNYLIGNADLKDYATELLLNTSNFLGNFAFYELNKAYGLPLYKADEQLGNDYLENLCFLGLKKRLHNAVDEVYLERLQYELKVITAMGFANYFLIVYDYVLYAKTHDIIVGPGRGSSAGSLVAYCLGITEVDPIKNKMLFERFLNPERSNLPDIDVDFEDAKRYLIFDYLKQKYGVDNVAHICTFDTLKARNSLEDVGKVFNIASHRLKMIKDLLPKLANVSLREVIKDNNELKLLLSANSDLSYVYDIASRLEGLNRHLSTHASGVIVNSDSLLRTIPVLKDNAATLMSQYNMDYLEKIGLYKMDVLGLATLGVLRSIKKYLADDINFYKIDIEDKKTLALLSTGNTLGVFQFESEGVMKVLRRMKVDSINDLCVTTALFRPGPMQFIDEYIARKNEGKKFTYLTPSVKPILEETYGIIVYQEQVMQITQVIASFSLGKADIVRKGMAKKDKNVLEEIRQDFISSALKNNYSTEVAHQVFDVILDFSGYGFNKTHAYSYALLAFYLAYFKANYPIAFFRAVLSNNVNNNAKLKKYFYEMKVLYNFEVSNPDLNKSSFDYEVEGEKFILPLISIDGIGMSTATQIMQERQDNPFGAYHTTIIRLIKIGISRGNIENLIYAGALDFTELNRTTMINNLDKLYNLSNLLSDKDINQSRMAFNKRAENEGIQNSLLNNPQIIKYSENDSFITTQEYRLLGLYLSSHPLHKYMNEYAHNMLGMIKKDNKALAIIDHVKEIRTKKGDLMAFVQASDSLETKTLVVFPKVYRRCKMLLKNKNIVLLTGRLDDKDDSNIIVDDIELLKREEDNNDEESNGY